MFQSKIGIAFRSRKKIEPEPLGWHELRAKAKALGVEKYSFMNREELERAVANCQQQT